MPTNASPIDSNRWPAAQSILCVRLDSLGDVLMTTPALRALKSLPGRPRLTLLTSSGGMSAARLVPEIEEAWCADVAWLKHTPPRPSPDVDLQLIEKIRNASFDACVIFTVLTQNPLPSAMIAYLAGIPLRLAYCRENPYQLLSDWVQDTENLAECRHEVVRQLDLVRYVGAVTNDQRLRLHISSSVNSRMLQWLERMALRPHARWCIIHPGATAESRRYPAEAYSRVAQKLEATGFRIVLTGGASEASLISQVAQHCADAIALVDQFCLEELAALIANAPLLLTNNTGPAHIAAAVGTPVVDLYALTNPQHTPWQVPHRLLNFDVPCRNCLKSVCPEGHHDCLRRVTPEEVCSAVHELWQATHCQLENPKEPSLCIH